MDKYVVLVDLMKFKAGARHVRIGMGSRMSARDGRASDSRARRGRTYVYESEIEDIRKYGEITLFSSATGTIFYTSSVVPSCHEVSKGGRRTHLWQQPAVCATIRLDRTQCTSEGHP
jgi:hypothetical protein